MQEQKYVGLKKWRKQQMMSEFSSSRDNWEFIFYYWWKLSCFLQCKVTDLKWAFLYPISAKSMQEHECRIKTSGDYKFPIPKYILHTRFCINKISWLVPYIKWKKVIHQLVTNNTIFCHLHHLRFTYFHKLTSYMY